jgi:Ca-activated chloride channel homolog
MDCEMASMKKITLTAISISLVAIVSTSASDFWTLWLTPDQKGRWHFDNGNYDKSAQYFENAHWKSLAFYKAEKFEAAAKTLQHAKKAEEFFLLGNSYARAENLAEAIVAYNSALTLNPIFKEAEFNLEWVQGLYEIDQKTYDDNGGTGGKIGADRSITQKMETGQGTDTTTQQLKSEGLSDAQLEEMWMRRVQTTLSDFLQLRFAYQFQNRSQILRKEIEK